MAKKDAYYFSHDANARNDVKCLKLRREMGLEGYGIFWALIEMLREDDEHKLPVSLIEDIAFNLHTSKEKIEAVIRRYELFEIDSDYFFSSRLIRSMIEYKELKTKLSEAGRKGGLSGAKGGLKQPRSIKGKEKKENEIKGNERLQSEISEMLGRASIGFSYEQLYCEAGKMINKYDIKNSGEAVNLINKWAGNMVKETELQTNDIARYV